MKTANTIPDISICVATYKRPDQLERLLDSLAALYPGPFAYEIIVVDNDTEQTAREVVERKAADGFTIRYYHEPEQNIALARNLAVRSARADWIAFIDDDEVATSDWLVAFWRCKNCDGDGFFGPVLPRVDGTQPNWLDAELFFYRPRFATGYRLDFRFTRTANAFLRRSLFDQFQFDPKFGLTGGSDIDLFARMLDSGAKFFWCDEAKVFEYQPEHRLTFSWLLQRSFRGGISYTQVQKQRTGLLKQAYAFAKAVFGIFLFTLLVPLELLRGRVYAIQRILRIAVQFGHLFGALNYEYEEYRKRKEYHNAARAEIEA